MYPTPLAVVAAVIGILHDFNGAAAGQIEPFTIRVGLGEVTALIGHVAAGLQPGSYLPPDMLGWVGLGP